MLPVTLRGLWVSDEIQQQEIIFYVFIEESSCVDSYEKQYDLYFSISFFKEFQIFGKATQWKTSMKAGSPDGPMSL